MRDFFSLLLWISSTLLLSSQSQPTVDGKLSVNEVDSLIYQNSDSAISLFYNSIDEDSSLIITVGLQLINWAHSQQSDSLIVELRYELGEAMLYWENLEEAKMQFDNLVSYAKQRNLTEGISFGYKGLGDLSEAESKFQKAVEYFNLAEDGWKQTNNYQRLGYLYNNIGVSYRKQGNNFRALQYYLKAVDMLKKTDDPRALAYISNNIANIYFDQNNLEEALKFHLLVLESAERLQNDLLIATALNNIGLISDKKGERKNAMSYFHQALLIGRQAGIKESIILSMTNVGESHVDHLQNDSAIFYLKEVLKMSNSSGDIESQGYALIGLGKAYLALENFYQAKIYFREGLLLSERAQQGANIVEASRKLAILEERQGNYDNALNYERLSRKVSDSLKQIEISNNLALLQAEYEFKVEQEESTSQINTLRSENQIQELRLGRRNLLVWIFGILFLSALIISYLIYNHRLVSRGKEANDLKQKLLRVQLNPHFMFNSLNAIQNMVFREIDKHRTADYLARFSHLTRQILELNQRDFITLSDEIKFIENYLSIQKIRFDEPFEFNITVAEEVETDMTLIPPMITQPFLENAIEHGIINKKDKGTIRLVIQADNSHLNLKIEDNGIGREKAAFAKKVSNHRSLATQITNDRLDNLEKSFRKKASMHIEDIIKNNLVCGTRVHFMLPIKFSEI